jgi:hypothetical protein
MRRSYVRIAGLALLALMGVPSASHASIWDWIWGMSGPQMVGIVFHCEWDWEPKDPNATKVDDKGEPYTASECRFVDYKVVGNARARTQRTMWLTFDTNGYTSTGKNSEGFDFKAFENYMVAFEPMLEIRSFTNAGTDAKGARVPGTGYLSFHHGLVGMSYDVLFGSDYGTFDKIGLKFRPIGFTYKKWNGALNIRVYPNGFTGDEFGVEEPRLHDINRPSETVWGFSMGYIWGP